ncbi:MAG: riboflavin biosynthesis protein RibF [Peptococcaceae bacterium]|nr:riboflavin biosynthesis protein RibF [Peptococcaceae bacterium]
MIVHHKLAGVMPQQRVVVLGNFDGLHLGHQQLIKQGRRLADQLNAHLTVLTFYPQWQSLHKPDFKYLSPQGDKMTHLESLSVDEVVTLPCDAEFASMSPMDFIENVLVKTLWCVGVVVGFNYTFGQEAKGTPEMLEQMLAPRGVIVHVEPPFEYGDSIVSSSLIRRQIRAGNMMLVKELLGYPYHLCGEVVHGAQNGRAMNFPTANISYDETLMLPSLGVYAARAWLVDEPEKRYDGVLNIGTRPTVDDSPVITVEVHMLDFDRDIYGKQLCVEIYHFLRHISKFKNLSELKTTITMDVLNAKKFFATNS